MSIIVFYFHIFKKKKKKAKLRFIKPSVYANRTTLIVYVWRRQQPLNRGWPPAQLVAAWWRFDCIFKRENITFVFYCCHHLYAKNNITVFLVNHMQFIESNKRICLHRLFLEAFSSYKLNPTKCVATDEKVLKWFQAVDLLWETQQLSWPGIACEPLNIMSD